MTTTIWWVRHGPTHEKAFVGHRDVPADLSDRALIAKVDAALPPDALVVSSDLIRASATADAIESARQRLAHDPNLREFDFGIWDGMAFDAVAARDPILSRQFWEEPGDITAPDGESWNMVADRVSRSVDRTIADHAPRHLIAVAHIGVIMTQIARAAGCAPYQAMSHQIDNLSITDMTFDGTAWSLGRINHLP